MKYIKCNDCNNYNLLNSEYLTFCNNCGKKLLDNYKSWKKVNPTKNFNDFKKQIGITKSKSSTKKKISAKKVIQICFIAISIALGTYYSQKYSPNLIEYFYKQAYPVSDLLNSKWERQFFMGNKIAIESPYWLEKQEDKVSLPEEVEKLVKEIDYYAYRNYAGFGAVVMTSVYDESIQKVDLKGASNGGIQQPYTTMNGSDLFYNDEDIKINNYPAILKKGNFMSDGKQINFKSVACVKKDLTLIYVLTYWTSNNKDYDLLTDRMVGSLEIY